MQIQKQMQIQSKSLFNAIIHADKSIIIDLISKYPFILTLPNESNVLALNLILKQNFSGEYDGIIKLILLQMQTLKLSNKLIDNSNENSLIIAMQYLNSPYIIKLLLIYGFILTFDILAYGIKVRSNNIKLIQILLEHNHTINIEEHSTEIYLLLKGFTINQNLIKLFVNFGLILPNDRKENIIK